MCHTRNACDVAKRIVVPGVNLAVIQGKCIRNEINIKKRAETKRLLVFNSRFSEQTNFPCTPRIGLFLRRKIELFL